MRRSPGAPSFWFCWNAGTGLPDTFVTIMWGNQPFYTELGHKHQLRTFHANLSGLCQIDKWPSCLANLTGRGFSYFGRQVGTFPSWDTGRAHWTGPEPTLRFSTKLNILLTEACLGPQQLILSRVKLPCLRHRRTQETWPGYHGTSQLVLDRLFLPRAQAISRAAGTPRACWHGT